MSVYFAERDGLIKIGWSQNVPERMRSLKTNLLGAIDGGRSMEKSIHEKFAHLRVRGEWHEPSKELLEYIRGEAQKHEPDRKRIAQIAIRLPKSWFPRFDKVAERMSQPGLNITRAEVMRLALHHGLKEIESEQGKKR